MHLNSKRVLPRLECKMALTQVVSAFRDSLIELGGPNSLIPDLLVDQVLFTVKHVDSDLILSQKRGFLLDESECSIWNLHKGIQTT